MTKRQTAKEMLRRVAGEPRLNVKQVRSLEGIIAWALARSKKPKWFERFDEVVQAVLKTKGGGLSAYLSWSYDSEKKKLDDRVMRSFNPKFWQTVKGDPEKIKSAIDDLFSDQKLMRGGRAVVGAMLRGLQRISPNVDLRTVARKLK